MIVANLISEEIVPLQADSTITDATLYMQDYHLAHLPVVRAGAYLGIVDEDSLLDAADDQPVSSLLPAAPPSTFVRHEDHVYEAVRLFASQRISLIPVLNEEDNFVGVVTIQKLLATLAEMGSFSDPGSIVVLEMGRHDYSLAEIARIVESEGAIILSSNLQSFPDSNRIQITLKLNGRRIAAILATFERFDYHIRASFNEVELQNALKKRYDHLINYLNI